MNRTVIAAALLIGTASLSARAEAPAYDYASKFYPHPAMLFLHAEAPRTMSDHPAVLVARRAQADAAVVAQACSPWDPRCFAPLPSDAPTSAHPVRVAQACSPWDPRC